MSKSDKKRMGITRTTAEKLLAELPKRAEAINADPQYLFGISRIEVFGSYLTEKAKLGDIDIAVQFSPKNRNPQEHWQLCQEQGAKEGPADSSFLGQLVWAQNKVLRALRAKHYAFSLHSYDELEFLKKEHQATGRELYRNPQFDPPSIGTK